MQVEELTKNSHSINIKHIDKKNGPIETLVQSQVAKYLSGNLLNINLEINCVTDVCRSLRIPVFNAEHY